MVSGVKPDGARRYEWHGKMACLGTHSGKEKYAYMTSAVLWPERAIFPARALAANGSLPRQPGSQAARQLGSQAARQPGSHAPRQPGAQAPRRPWGRGKPWTCTYYIGHAALVDNRTDRQTSFLENNLCNRIYCCFNVIYMYYIICV